MSQKSDKGNSKVIIARVNYIQKMEKFLSDSSKFQKTTPKDDKFLNFVTSQEKRMIKFKKSFLTLTACLKKHKDV